MARIGRYEVIHAFKPSAGSECASELPLAIGNIVEVTETHESGWWAGHVLGQTRQGWFPAVALRQLTNVDPNGTEETRIPSKVAAASRDSTSVEGGVSARSPLRRRASERSSPVVKAVPVKESRPHNVRSASLDTRRDARRGPPSLPTSRDARSPVRLSTGAASAANTQPYASPGMRTPSRAITRTPLAGRDARRTSLSPAPPMPQRRGGAGETVTNTGRKASPPSRPASAGVDATVAAQATRDGRRIATPLSGSRAGSPPLTPSAAQCPWPPTVPRLRATLPPSMGQGREAAVGRDDVSQGKRSHAPVAAAVSHSSADVPPVAATVTLGLSADSGSARSVGSARSWRQVPRPKRTSYGPHLASRSTTTATESSSDVESAAALEIRAQRQQVRQLQDELRASKNDLARVVEDQRHLQDQFHRFQQVVNEPVEQKRRGLELQCLQRERTIAAERRQLQTLLEETKRMHEEYTRLGMGPLSARSSDSALLIGSLRGVTAASASSTKSSVGEDIVPGQNVAPLPPPEPSPRVGLRALMPLQTSVHVEPVAHTVLPSPRNQCVASVHVEPVARTVLPSPRNQSVAPSSAGAISQGVPPSPREELGGPQQSVRRLIAVFENRHA
eukprot:TRINITY_DN13419_c0_g1_i1.p1 TRINITY_DN13419_c0_g1~~TRINITY_DN13419_c0_g1_i1.p1  ORF type:complete len:619 (-),score=49.47 TRINITY_DN13419_c0_g1_i1:254-2110(-)